jgi:hypothetical protein
MRFYISGFEPQPRNTVFSKNSIVVDTADISGTHIKTDATYSQLKQHLFTTYKLPVNKYYLTFNGKMFKDDDLLSSKNVVDNSIIRFYVRTSDYKV